MDKELRNRLNEFNQAVTAAGEDVVFRAFPTKILELQIFIQSTNSPDSPFHISHASSFTDVTVYPPISHNVSDEPQTKKRKKSNGSIEVDEPTLRDPHDTENIRFFSHVRANMHISQRIHQRIKNECEQMVDLVDKVKLWVTLTMPKIEDGDNFGVQIQEEALAELHRAQESAYNIRDTARQDNVARAKLCAKLIKYPGVEDYILALKEHDEKQLYLGRQHLFDIRNIYAVLTDMLHKNISKIRAPKANNSVSLY